MPRGVEPAGPSREELWEEFLQIVVHYNIWKHVRMSYEDGQIDIGESDWGRLQDLVGELGIKERNT